MNGDTNGKRAAAPLPAYDETPNLHGGGGEIYRGYYYYPDLYRQYSKKQPGRPAGRGHTGKEIPAPSDTALVVR